MSSDDVVGSIYIPIPIFPKLPEHLLVLLVLDIHSFIRFITYSVSEQMVIACLCLRKPSPVP
jgi:hypothetical protein